MRELYPRMIEAVFYLNPKRNEAVRHLNLHFRNGKVFPADDVTVEQGVIVAKGFQNVRMFHYTTIDNLVGFDVRINEDFCVNHDCTPDVTGALDWAKRRAKS
jgi:hypothetical protein